MWQMIVIAYALLFPYVSQAGGRLNDCGPAAASMVLRWYGQEVEPGDFYTELAIEGDPMLGAGWIALWLERHGLRMTEAELGQGLALVDYGALRAAGLVEGRTWYNHWVVVVQVLPDWVIVHDPLVGPAIFIPREAFKASLLGMYEVVP